MRGLATTLQERLGFTRNEVIVITLLAGSFLTGIAVRWLGSTGDPTGVTGFDYSHADSVFLARSSARPASQAQNYPAGIASTPKLRSGEKRVNLNNAAKADLMRVPGIGPGLAERIIAYRTQHGPFASVDALANIAGIGGKTLDRIREFVVTE